MQELKWEDMGVKIDGRQLHHLRFADDIVLTTPSISQVERMLTDFDCVCGKVVEVKSEKVKKYPFAYLFSPHRPAYEDPCHITWCMTAQVFRDSATASAGADAHSQSPASVRSMRGSLMRGRHRGATELVRKSRNVSRTRVATLNVGDEVACHKSRDIGRGFKAVLCGSPRTTSGVGVIVSERFRDSIVSVERFNDRLMKIVVVR
ncbi:unnamed protein product [Heligmosomoides polygyrus]|uniref:Reverse transcriptase domain-containing protein n=1 Tax=Heligmosomoides polygyrus TaxID=6339 RepID=A0A183G225_HELPZ|nr:unnamed protein product [Heligmosomoides polygyrus]